MSKPLPLVIKEATLQQLTKPFPQFCNQCHAWIYSICCKVSMLKTLYKKSKKRFSWYNKKKKPPQPNLSMHRHGKLFSMLQNAQRNSCNTWAPSVPDCTITCFSNFPEMWLFLLGSGQTPAILFAVFISCSQPSALLSPPGNTWQFASPLRFAHRATWGEESIEDRDKTMVSCLEVS